VLWGDVLVDGHNHIWRYRGFCDALSRAGVAHPAEEVRFGRDTIEAGRSEAHSLLAAVPDLTALFVSNDLPAIGALQAAADLGLAVPGELSVCGITDIQLAREVRPALTTVAAPTAEAAQLAVDSLMNLINEDPRGGDAGSRIATISAPRLIVRASTGRAAKR